MNARRLAAALLIACLASAAPAAAQEVGPVPPSEAPALKAFLRGLIPKGFEDETLTYSAATAALCAGQRPWTLVHLAGRSACGSGGCTTLILAPKGHGFRVVKQVSVSRLPVRVLTTTSKGCRDLGVSVSGGGVQPGYEALLRFDGKSYPGNPTVPPATPAKPDAAGKVVLAEGDPTERLFDPRPEAEAKP